jgi:hypothetical protein
MENKNSSFDDTSSNKKKIFHLDEINEKLLETFKTRKTINKLYNMYAKNLNELNEVSKQIKPIIVNVIYDFYFFILENKIQFKNIAID